MWFFILQTRRCRTNELKKAIIANNVKDVRMYARRQLFPTTLQTDCDKNALANLSRKAGRLFTEVWLNPIKEIGLLARLS